MSGHARWDAGMYVDVGRNPSKRTAMGFDDITCECLPNADRSAFKISRMCSVHNKDFDNPFDKFKPVQLTVGATYYEKSMIGEMPAFMHYQCGCERVGYDDERQDNVFKVMSGCRMHDPASNQRNSFPVAKTVMK